MTIEIGDRMPDATLLQFDGSDIVEVDFAGFLAGKTVAVFAMPGAFTRMCSSRHMPSVIDSAEGLRQKGADEVVCLTTNDPFANYAWAQSNGAAAAGVTMLADPQAKLTKTLGMDFSAPERGLVDRSQRYAMILKDGVVVNAEIEEPGACSVSTGEHVLALMDTA